MQLAEPGDGLGHDRCPGAREGHQPQAPAAQARHGLELGLGVGQPAQDVVGVAEQDAAGVGEVHPARAALDELHARLALERGDLLGHGGLRVGERLGGGGERALAPRPP